ncbi:hypothetical protein PSTT_11584 [Puccinia striiformis]|uniref:Uncharacterized protein n=1 Tax=Puccinia striiformis TaxID=27350 RepID=A0A2S4UZP4_9BASI|nr:hypothetical protein PSTT_11584 [Puccinia striiformis]
MSDQLNTLSNTVHNATPNPNPLLNKDSLVENMLTYQSTRDQPTGSQDPTGAQGCCNSVPSLNSLKRNKDSLLNLDTQKNKLDDLVGSLVIILDHQPISTIVNSHNYHPINKNKHYLNLANNLSRCYSQELLYQPKVK